MKDLIEELRVYTAASSVYPPRLSTRERIFDCISRVSKASVSGCVSKKELTWHALIHISARTRVLAQLKGGSWVGANCGLHEVTASLAAPLMPRRAQPAAETRTLNSCWTAAGRPAATTSESKEEQEAHGRRVPKKRRANAAQALRAVFASFSFRFTRPEAQRCARGCAQSYVQLPQVCTGRTLMHGEGIGVLHCVEAPRAGGLYGG